MTEKVPEDVKVVLYPDQKGTPIQIEESHHHFKYAMVPPGSSIPSGPNIKIIQTKLTDGTLIEFEENGVKRQTVIPPGQQIPPGSIVLRRPDGKPPPGTLVSVTQSDGKTIQLVIPPGQPLPHGAVVIPTQFSHPSAPAHHPTQPPPPSNVSLSNNDDSNRGISGENSMPPPPGSVSLDSDDDDHHPKKPSGISLEKNDSNNNVPAYAQFSQPSDDTPKSSEQPAYLQFGQNDQHQQQSQPPPPSPYMPYGQQVSHPIQPTQPQQPPPPQQPQQRQSTYQQPAYQQSSAQPRPQSVPQGKSKPPIWVTDQSSDHCSRCKQEFSLTNRRHHCRNCGNLFCGNCTQNQIGLPHYSLYAPERVCDACYETVTGKPAPHNTGGGGGCVIS